MKHTLMIAALVVLSALGCAKKETTAAPQENENTSPTPTPTPTPGGGGGLPGTPGGSRGNGGSSSQTWYWPNGGSAILTIDNQYVFEQYTGRPMNAPLDVRLNVDLQPTDYNGQQVYIGTIKVGYHDFDEYQNKKYHEGVFDSGYSASDARHNKWLPDGWYKGFYEDAAGALILVINHKDDNNMMSGEIFFRNYNWNVCNSQPPYDCGYKPPTKCWFITRGPYQCGDYLVNGVIDMMSRQYPVTYTRLGTFEGLDFKRAFKN